MVMAQMTLDQIQMAPELFRFRVWYERYVPALRRSIHSIQRNILATCVASARRQYLHELSKEGIETPAKNPEKIKAVKVGPLEPSQWVEHTGTWGRCRACPSCYPIEQLHDPAGINPGVCFACRVALGKAKLAAQPAEIIGADPAPAPVMGVRS